ncbi:hypothetical protein H6G33_36430 [Calothrix sp. FACHB-1219]|uniref:hypothetical protein n=1 Tax=unclassified Calothrix TaxID=2619626 RepID=UPI001689B3F0|nr:MULTISPECIES: hypothetical protein [unclassified Calothrix]MBD2207845.1 hypothetical protein [Calothrix sp. FACHB-168]MBD2222420.1 hypothetical protein [Calothrix sp. FACHB-1219]
MQTSDLVAFTALIISLYGIWKQNKGVQEQILAQNKNVQEQILAQNKNVQEQILAQNKNVQEQILAQNNGVRQQILVTNISEYTRRYQEIFEKLPKTVIEEDFKIDSFSENEQVTILRPMWLYFDLCYEEYTLYHELNLIDEKVWRLWESAMISSFSRPAFYQCWNLISQQSFYPQDFSKFVNDIMLKKHNLQRKI